MYIRPFLTSYWREPLPLDVDVDVERDIWWTVKMRRRGPWILESAWSLSFCYKFGSMIWGLPQTKERELWSTRFFVWNVWTLNVQSLYCNEELTITSYDQSMYVSPEKIGTGLGNGNGNEHHSGSRVKGWIVGCDYHFELWQVIGCQLHYYVGAETWRQGMWV